MKAKIISENVEYKKVVKNYQVEFNLVINEGDLLETKKITLEFSKMWEDSNADGYDNNYEFYDESVKVFQELDDYNQEEIIDYINDINQ